MHPCRHGFPTPRVLVIEDEGLIATIVVDLLTDEGYEVERMHNGRSALVLVQIWTPCLILLDIMMPVMDGQRFLRELERLQPLAAIPVVVVSGAGGPMLANLGMRVADVIRKPFDVDRLVATVGRLAR
jgi:two-component system chemotaxis response regulator CheY